MKRLAATSLILLALLLISSFHNMPKVLGETEDVNYFIRSTVMYTNPAGNTNSWEFTEDDRTISLFMNNTWQTVELVNSTLAVEAIKKDEDGNPFAVLQFPLSTLTAGRNVSFTVWYHIVSKPRTIPSISENESGNLPDIPSDLRSRYTREEGPWQTNIPSLQNLAFSLRGSEIKVLTIIKNFIVWMKDPKNMNYPKTQHENPYYPNQTYALREGDCDDQAMLFITLCRIVGIPSYLQLGSIYMPTQFENSSFWDEHVSIVERRIGWHGWAVVYVPPWGWLPVDLTYVPEGFRNPLNAIKYGAVTDQETIQYMNFTSTDYVALSLEDRAFLTNNGFRVYMEDEMILDAKQDGDQTTTTTGLDPWLPLALIALTAFALVASFLISRRWSKRRAEEAQRPQG